MDAKAELTIHNLRWRGFFAIFAIGAIAMALQVVISLLTGDTLDLARSITSWAMLWFGVLAIAQWRVKRVSPLLEQLGIVGALGFLLLQYVRFVAGVYQNLLSPDVLAEVIPWMGVAYAAIFIVFPTRRALWVSGLLLVFIAAYWAYFVFSYDVPGIPHYGLQALVDTTMAGIVLVLLMFILKRMTEVGAKAEARADAMTELAHKDSLTGLYNRRYLDKRLADEYKRAQRYQQPLSVALCDLDFFKSINDRLSHAVGDAALKAVADVLAKNTRDVDVVARYGGEEFVLLLNGTPKAQAVIACEKIRAAIETYDWSSVHPDLQVTASFGVSDDTSLLNHEKLLNAADKKLYAAKNSGKNQVCA